MPTKTNKELKAKYQDLREVARRYESAADKLDNKLKQAKNLKERIKILKEFNELGQEVTNKKEEILKTLVNIEKDLNEVIKDKSLVDKKATINQLIEDVKYIKERLENEINTKDEKIPFYIQSSYKLEDFDSAFSYLK